MSRSLPPASGPFGPLESGLDFAGAFALSREFNSAAALRGVAVRLAPFASPAAAVGFVLRASWPGCVEDVFWPADVARRELAALRPSPF